MSDEIMEIAAESTRGGFFLVTGTALSTIIMAIASILVARFLGAELYGQYTLALVIPQILLLFADLGINQGIIKYTSSLHKQGETTRIIKIIKYGILLKSSAGIVIFIISYMCSGILSSALLQRPELASYVKIASISILFYTIFATLTSAFVGLAKTEYNALVSIAQATAKALLSILLVLLGFGVLGAIVGYVASYGAAIVAGALLLIAVVNSLKGNSPQKCNGNVKDLKELIRYGTPLYISTLLTGFIPFYQSIVLAFFTSDIDIGNFKASANFIALMAVVTIPISTALLPAFSKLNSSFNHGIRRFFKLANKYTTLVILPITFFMITFSHEIVKTIYGSTYNSAPTFLATYCIIFLLAGVGYLTLTSLFNGMGDTKTTLKMNLITFLGFLILASPLTQSYKVIGLILSLIIANALGTTYGAYIGVKKYRIEFDKRSILKVYLCSMVSTVPAYVFLRLTVLPNLINIAIGGLLYIFTYITLIPLTKAITATELKAIALGVQKIKILAYATKPLIKYQQKILKI